ncbi:zinc finger (ccch type) domain-containing protein [Cyclospora cayetanensis]|uniref:Zinc finger (Ccch type) domain-containing protein n=1 Tax=Cyclospora cayetanensis TaxID=88456 RepID=A0A1D3D511_9EIME|nr:zinc finger (ccch type) domain-containing protein [Cyclospora cayetanensis]
MTAEVCNRNSFDMAGAAAAIASSSSSGPKRLQQRIAEELRISYLTPSGGANEGNNGNHGSGSKPEEDADDAQILAEYILHLLLREKAPTARLLEELKEFLGQPVRSFVVFVE